MEEDTEYKKLPVDERCTHKLWKARVDGYEEAVKLFRSIDDEKSPDWNKFLGLIKKFVIDSNAVAQEKGLEAALVFVENCGNAGKTVGEVMSGIVTKCIGAPKAKTKDLAVQIAMMYIEIEKHEIVVEELLKGTEQKNPKISASCVSALLLALREFGSKVIPIKPLVKKIPALLADRDKTVRDESKQLTIEIFRWIGPVFKSQIATLPAVVLTELETEFEKVKNDKAIPARYLRSQQQKQMMEAVSSGGAEVAGDEDADVDEAEEIDPMDLIDPVDILSKLPKDFYEKLEAKKWQERKEALEALEPLLQNPKLQNGDYGELVRALKKVITKDTNVVLVAMAGKQLALLAKGLGKKFQPYSVVCVAAILEKFKEKKANVVTALKEAIDAIYVSTNLEAIQEDVLAALASKNPSVKAETASFLARCFTKTVPTILNKKLLKAYVTALIKTLNESDPTVRDASADALGTAMKLVGDKNIAPYLTEVDALKMEKIKEYFEKAVITVKVTGVKKEPARPQSAPAKQVPAKAGSSEPKAVQRPQSAVPPKKAAAKKPGGAVRGGVQKSESSSKVLPTERDMTPEEIDEEAVNILPPDVCSGLTDAQWKIRLSAVESFLRTVPTVEAKTGNSQILIRTLAKKPGFKENNVQVLKLRIDAVKLIAETQGLTVTTTDYIMNDITEKLSDAKTNASASEALTSIAEAIRLEYVVSKVMTFAFEQKSPKVQENSILWVNQAIREFGFQLNPKLLIDDARKGILSSNVAVRTATITLLGTMYLYMGNTLAMFFDNEKPALKQSIQAEFDKNAGQNPPAPIRGPVMSKKASSPDNDDDMGDDDATSASGNMNVNDLLPRVDISGKISEALLTELCDKNWKTRNEGLIKLQNILNENKLIKPNLGDLPQIISQRLVDSNAKIAQTTVEIVQQLVVSMGPSCKQHVRSFFPGLLKGLGDNKGFLRAACITCINTIGEQCGYKEFFESEMIADALKTGTPTLKVEVWGWLSEKLPKIPPKSISKEELVACMPHLYANICDRSADVRKNANEAVLGIMIHVGYEAMVKALDKQKPASKKDIQASLDKARPNLPVKPLPENRRQAPALEEKPKASKPGASKIVKPVATKPGAPVVSRKKEEDIDTSPLLAVNNIKHQRLLDEQKLKVLKWTFTTPREEFTDLLKDQMNTANVNRNLMANMFHDDFRYHLKVIESLIEDLPGNSQGLVSNLDLILKWLSLRFYDTNPSVLLKGLDYLNFVFQMLVDRSYVLADNEGSSFIPHLLTKIGDPKDTVRNGVRNLLRQICMVHPFSKVFAYLMDALKSKNARQRTECLDELGYLIETYNITVCQPTPQHALKEIAKHISDRDNSVRSAALNCIVKAYDIAGERVYKLIGQLSEKDLSMLDERIKRSKRTTKVPQMDKMSTGVNIEVVNVPVEPDEPAEDESTSEEERKRNQVSEEMQQNHVNEMKFRSNVNGSAGAAANHNSSENPSDQPPEPVPVIPQIQQRVTGPFRLDPDVIAEIERDWVKSDQMKDKSLTPIDLSFMNEPIKIALTNGIGYPTEKLNLLLSNSPSRPQSANATLYNTYHHSPSHNLTATSRVSNSNSEAQPAVNNLNISLPKLDSKLLQLIKNVGNQDSYIAHASLIELCDILEIPEKQAVLRDYEEIYMQSILLQFKFLAQRPFTEAVTLYQPLLHSLFLFFNSKALGQQLTIVSIKSIISVLLGLMADNKFSTSGDDYTKIMNNICLRILDRCNFTNLNIALVRLLQETCLTSGLPKFTDLLMKCIWRNVKLMPNRAHELDYEALLLEIHDFMQRLPSQWWTQRPSDTPMRTVKTIVHNITKIKGNAILQYLNKIPRHSELNTYVLRILKNLQKDGTIPSTDEQQPSQPQMHSQKDRLSKQTHDSVSSIFNMISDKETSQLGLQKLYEFKEKNPDVDLNPFMIGANSYFQQYIKNGLEEIQRMNQNATNNNDLGACGDTIHSNRYHQTNNSGASNPDVWMQKLNTLRMRANLPSTDDNNQYDNKIADENLNLNQIQTKMQMSRKDVQADHLSPNRREELQQRLAMYKQK